MTRAHVLRQWPAVFLALVCALSGSQARAQTDEIQVYDASIEAPGKFGITWHNNFTPIGRSKPDFTGGIATNHTLNGVPEFSYGAWDWLELGLYLPVYSITGSGQVLFDATKLRALFVAPHADERRVFYGVNFELSYNEPHWEPRRFRRGGVGLGGVPLRLVRSVRRPAREGRRG